jgi:hypothetical protein
MFIDLHKKPIKSKTHLLSLSPTESNNNALRKYTFE